MRYSLPIILIGLALVGAGCWTNETKAQKNCSNAQNPYACHLDQALNSQDPSYCAYVMPNKHALCLNAYSEITGQKIICNKLQDQELQRHCLDYAPQGEILPVEFPVLGEPNQP